MEEGVFLLVFEFLAAFDLGDGVGGAAAKGLHGGAGHAG